MIVEYIISAVCLLLMFGLIGLYIWTTIDNNKAWKQFLKETSVKIQDLKIKEVELKKKK